MRCSQHKQLQHIGQPLLGLSIAALLWFGHSIGLTEPLPLADPPVFEDPTADKAAPEGEPEFTFYVKQIRVRGSQLLSRGEIENTIYPYLGPGRTLDDLEQARAALEKSFRDKGFQTVTVELPQQNGTRGIIFMDVVENKVGRLTVKGARYHLPSEIKKAAPSLAEGTTPDFNQVTKDILALNNWADRQVIPTIRPGIAPHTVDVELEVKDKSPLHGSIELNNRYIANTTELRLDTSFSYGNLWQRGHTFGMSSQIAPQDLDDSQVISAYYLARFPQLSKFTLQFLATKQDSLVSTLGGLASVGDGSVLGLRGNFQLDGKGRYFHSATLGFDYKDFRNDIRADPRFDELPPDQQETLANSFGTTPIYYYPIVASYGGGYAGESSFTDFNVSLNLHLRGLGSEITGFDKVRYDSDGGWLYVRSEVSHTKDFENGMQVFGKFQSQLSNNSLINNEQFVVGGTSTVRGYLEATALGDNGWVFNFEVRSPSLIKNSPKSPGGLPESEFRFRTFFDTGTVYINEVLPEQIESNELASFGFGTTIKLWDHLNGNLDLAWPLVSQFLTEQHEPFLSFQVGSEF
jgi:hemolysin activation/secretion protein